LKILSNIIYSGQYAAFYEFVVQPQPLEAITPSLLQMMRLIEVLAVMRLFKFGIRNQNFIHNRHLKTTRSPSFKIFVLGLISKNESSLTNWKAGAIVGANSTR